MARAGAVARMSYAEYVEREGRGAERHEFLDGQVYAMAGGTPEHGALAAAIIRELGIALKNRPCRVYSSDVRVRVVETGLSTYQDASVVCGQLETDREDRDAIVNPTLIVEVLSESTEAYDRGAKASHYRRIPSLREYVLLAQDEARIEVYRRIDRDRWELVEARAGARVALASLDLALDVDTVYANPLAASA